MTLLSKCILAGYVILHALFIFLLDHQLKKHMQTFPAYRKARWIWIIPFAAAAAAPVAATFLPKGKTALSLQRFGNVFLAFDMHIAGLFLIVTLFSWIVFLLIRVITAGSRPGQHSPSRKAFSGKLPLWLLLLILAAGIVVPLYGLHHAQDTVVHFFKADLREDTAVRSEAAPDLSKDGSNLLKNGFNLSEDGSVLSKDDPELSEDGFDFSEDGSGRSAIQDGLSEQETSGKELRIALIADLHLSVNSHLSTTQNMVRLINEQEPDIVLVAGDIFTSSYAALRDPEKYAEAISGIRAPMGVFAVYGNHDVEETLFSGFAVHPVSQAFRPKQIEQFFLDCGFTILCDQTVSIADNTILLAGRIDGNKAGDGTKNRMTPDELLKDADTAKPVLVLEHEPVEYKELREAGADMVFSGHTHNGQIFPGSLFVNLMNENAYGQKVLYGMETFVTSGVGTFGPPMRTGTDSEIMIIDVLY